MLFEAKNINDFERYIMMSDTHHVKLILCVVNDDTDTGFIEHFKTVGRNISHIAVLINVCKVPRLPFLIDIPQVPFLSLYQGWLQCLVWTPKSNTVVRHNIIPGSIPTKFV